MSRLPLAALAALALLAPRPGAAQQAPAAPPPAAPARELLTLSDAVRLARENQPQLRQARAGTLAATARAAEARSALFPQLGASAAYTRSTTNVRSGYLPLAGTRDETLSLGASASQLLWDFGQTSGRWQAARASAEAQRWSERAALLQAVLGARSAFFAARAAHDLVKVARETLANQEAHLRQIQGFVDVGRNPAIDLAQARTDRANAQVQLINAENGYDTAKAQLNLAMGVERSTDYDVADDTLPPVEGEDGTTDELLPEALRARPDVAALEQQRRSLEATLSAVQGGYLPSLGVTGAVRNDGALPLAGAAWNWSATATLNWNLFQGGLTGAQVEEARANVTSADSQLAGLRQQVRLDVEQARLAVRAAKVARGAAGEALVNARERLRLAEGRYQAGAGSVIELGDSQVALTAAGAQSVQAEYNLSTARAQLLRALGRIPSP